jgi:hypothetical protein
VPEPPTLIQSVVTALRLFGRAEVREFAQAYAIACAYRASWIPVTLFPVVLPMPSTFSTHTREGRRHHRRGRVRDP